MRAKIYKLIDPRTNEPKYIGYTSGKLIKRLKAHIRDAINNNNSYKQKWIRSVLGDGLIPIIRLIKRVEPEVWDKWEIYFIRKYKKRGHKLTNGTIGGKNPTLINKIRKRLYSKGGFSTYTHSDKAKEKMSSAKLGKTGKLCPNSKGVIGYNDKEELFFHSCQEASDFLKTKGISTSAKNISAAMRGYRGRTKAGGYNWKR